MIRPSTSRRAISVQRAVQRETLHRRCGTVTHAALGTIPGLERITSCCAAPPIGTFKSASRQQPTCGTQAMTSPILHVQALRKTFGATEVLRGIDLKVAPQELVFVIGPSG